MTRKISTGVAVLLAVLAFAPPAPGGRLTAAIQGKLTDSQGFPLVGAHAVATSPSLLGQVDLITSNAGTYVFANLPPGTYRLTVEMPGFKTIKAEGIVLAAGQTVRLDFTLEPSEVEDESVTRRPDAGLDRGSARLAAVIDGDLLTRIPMPRDFSAVLALAPGVVVTSAFPSLLASAHGAPVAGNVFAEDDIDVTDPVGGEPILRTNVDSISEVVIETAGLPADRDPGQGAYVNVLRRSGGNDFAGSLSLYATGKPFAKSLWPASEIGSAAARAEADKTNLDAAFTAGGAVLRDIGWFFTDFRLRSQTQDTTFEAWQDPLQWRHATYGWRDSDMSGLLKLSTRVTRKYSGSVEMSFSKVKEPVFISDALWNRPLESTRSLDGQTSLLLRAGVLYSIDSRTSLEASLRYAVGKLPLSLNAAGLTMPSYYDSVTGRAWGSGASNSVEERKRFRAGVTFTRFQDRILGADHELVAGADYENTQGASSHWKTDTLVMDYVDGSPYTLGLAVSPGSGETVGEGIIGFSLLPSSTSVPLRTSRNVKRVGAFLLDNLSLGRRVNLSLGLRFDRSDTQALLVSKPSVGNAVAVTIGQNVIEPVYGFNPFGAGAYAQLDSVITWNNLSPRFGLAIDLLGTGRTFLRGSFSRVPEALGLGYMAQLDPISADRIHDFYWYDENGNGKVDAADTYVAFPDNYKIYTGLYTRRIQPKLRPPDMDEWTAGLEHELLADFTLSARYISRSEKGVIGDVMYDPDSAQAWYTAQSSPAGWWVPFTTTVPATDTTPETSVTVYLRSTTAPAAFDRIMSVPELGWKYRGLEFSFRKRMSHNWQAYGSVVLSRTTGAAGLASLLSQGLASTVLTPNSFVNVDPSSRSLLDRPLAIRLMGTVRFKYDFYLSAYYRFMSGLPYARTVTVVPPSGWAAANGADVAPVTVYLESPGSKRQGAFRSLDFRLEKEFLHKGRTRWSVFLDALNVLGNKNRVIDDNAGTWYPDSEGTATGTQLLGSTHGQAIALSGVRVFALSLKLLF
ncbi:MAG TPA: carboxypeptidase regulatory-like domain-containing protein [Terriglobales bacterium]|nr:carboxypeptidase regulatory-like domain-containing protein [Terriglobales bacterium]